MTFDYIDSLTGFAQGELFTDEDEVREYFTPEAQIEMFGEDAITDTVILNRCAELVIENRWHM